MGERRLVILNTTIMTGDDGTYKLKTLTLEEAKLLAQDFRNVLSAVGHEATAQVLSELLGVNIPYNRIQYKQEKEDICLCFKLKGRLPEGKILTKEEIEDIGYEFKVIYAV